MKESKKAALTQFHRDKIIHAAEALFLEKGIGSTSMDNIAREADYSKATIYVYFKNKEEIISSIILISMKMYLEIISKVLSQNEDIFRKYYAVCNSLADFHRDHPLYYECLLKEINVSLEDPETPYVYHEIYNVGEEINKVIGSWLEEGINQGYVRNDIKVIETSFVLWAGISGAIRLANEKELYFTKYLHISRQEFLNYSFELLLKSILNKNIQTIK